MVALVLAALPALTFPNEIVLDRCYDWAVDDYGQRLWVLTWKNPATIELLKPGDKAPRPVAQVESQPYRFQVSAHGKWAVVFGSKSHFPTLTGADTRLIFINLDRPVERYVLDVDATGVSIFDDRETMRALVTVSDGSVLIVSTAGSELKWVRAKGSMDHGDVGSQVIIGRNEGRFFLVNQAQAVDIGRMEIEESDADLPTLTVYDQCSSVAWTREFIFSRTQYVPGETTHITFASNTLYLARLGESGLIERKVAFETEDRIYKCALTVDNVAWIEAATDDEEFSIRLRRVKLK